MSVDRFFEGLREEQDRARARADYVGTARVKLPRATQRRRALRPRALLFGVAAALALAAAVALFAGRNPEAGGQMEFSVGEKAETGRIGAFMVAPKFGELPLRFSDGTEVSLSAGAGARVLRVDSKGAHLVLEKGRAVASVVHRADSHWRVDAGPFEVAVVGTRFTVSWDPEGQALLLDLSEGAVVVSGSFLSESMRVGAGQTLRALCNERRAELIDRNAATPLEAEAVVTPPAAAPSAEAPAPATPREAREPGTGWQALAAAGKYREALALVEQAGFEAEVRRASGQDLLTLGDAARLTGNAARAREAYVAARGKLPGGGRATYGLGLTAFDQQGDFAAAARWFETYLAEQPSGSLRAEASGRLLESLSRSGQSAKARELAEQYLARYPKGAQAALAQQLVGRTP